MCDTDEAVGSVAALLQVDREALATGLCCRRFKAGQVTLTPTLTLTLTLPLTLP